MTTQIDRKNRRNEPRLRSQHHGWMGIDSPRDRDETKPAAPSWRVMSGGWRDNPQREIDETNPAAASDEREIDETNPAAGPNPRDFDKTKPQLRRIGRLCRLSRKDKMVRIARIARMGKSGRFPRFGLPSTNDLDERALRNPCSPAFLLHEYSVRSVMRSMVQPRLLGESRLFNNCHASVGANEMSNIDGDAFLLAQPVDACEGRFGADIASGDREESSVMLQRRPPAPSARDGHRGRFPPK